MPESLGVVIRHPAVWSVPVMVALVVVAMPLNGAFYEFCINYDPQGAAQQWEWTYTTHVYRHTSGMLGGQLLSLLTGILLARRHRHPVTAAIPLALLLAVVTVAVAFPLAGGTHPSGLPTRVIAAELVAYPLFAAAGVGLGKLRQRPALILAVALWPIMTIPGLMLDDAPWAPAWLLWLLPPLAASSALGQATLSLYVFTEPVVLKGDWGEQATAALLTGLTAYSIILNLLGTRYRRP